METRGLVAPNRETLLRQLREYAPAIPDGEHFTVSVLRIVLPCGASRVFNTFEDIPATALPCYCRKNLTPHFFIKYATLEGR